jgi:MFS family permease
VAKIQAPSISAMVLLGLPSLGLAFAVTTLTVYAPAILQNYTGPAITGLIIGVEGIFGLFMPFLSGAWSDHAGTVRGRFNYLIPATVIMAVALAFVGWPHTLAIIVPAIALFYIGYFAYLTPYWALYPDLIPKSHSGRSRSAEGTWQAIGSFLALLGGGFWVGLWRPLPFTLAGGVIVIVTAILGSTIIRTRAHERVKSSSDRVLDSLKYTVATLRRKPDLGRLAIANALWYGALHSMRAFVVLFFVQGLGHQASFVSGVIFPVVAIGMFVMSPLSGKLADKYGHHRVLLAALLLYGFGAWVPVISQSSWVLIIIPVLAGAATTVMILPYSVLMHLITDERSGAASSIMGVSRGVGSFLGPVLSGLAIEWHGNPFNGAHGYSALWAMVSLFVLASIPIFRRINLPGEPTART